MALLKSLNTDFGVPAAYWNVGETLLDYHKRRCQVRLYGFANTAARQAGKQPMAAMNIVLEAAAFPADANRASIYEEIKQMPEWADAESDEA